MKYPSDSFPKSFNDFLNAVSKPKKVEYNTYAILDTHSIGSNPHIKIDFHGNTIMKIYQSYKELTVPTYWLTSTTVSRLRQLSGAHVGRHKGESTIYAAAGIISVWDLLHKSLPKIIQEIKDGHDRVKHSKTFNDYPQIGCLDCLYEPYSYRAYLEKDSVSSYTYWINEFIPTESELQLIINNILAAIASSTEIDSNYISMSVNQDSCFISNTRDYTIFRGKNALKSTQLIRSSRLFEPSSKNKAFNFIVDVSSLRSSLEHINFISEYTAKFK